MTMGQNYRKEVWIMDKKAFETRINEEWEKYKANDIYPNIMLLGASGTGKSSLINHVFGDAVASVNDVKPETDGFHLYLGSNYGITVNLIDSAGYELGAEQYAEEACRIVNEGINGEPVHIVWYCIPAANKRIEDIDIEVLTRLLKEDKLKGRLCVVFTKTDMDSTDLKVTRAMKHILENKLAEEDLSVESFRVSVEDEYEFELEDLLEWSSITLDDDDLRDKFIGAQISSLDIKKKSAEKAVAIASAAAAVIGAVPIPFADAILLVPDQVLMVKRIIDIYGVSSLAHVSAQFVGSIVISQLAKLLASSLVKIIPFVGSWVGGVVNASVAGIITCAIGKVTSDICYSSIKEQLNGTEIDWANLFSVKDFSEKVSETAKEMFDSGSFRNDTSEVTFSDYMSVDSDNTDAPYIEPDGSGEDDNENYDENEEG